MNSPATFLATKIKPCYEKSSLILLLIAAGVYGISFGIILPIVFQDRVFSVYFNVGKYEANEIVDGRNQIQQKEARAYLDELDASKVFYFHNQRIQGGQLDILIVVATVRRNSNKDLKYLTQVVVSAHREISRSPEIKAAILICNMQYNPTEHKEAIYLSRYFPAVQRERSLRYMNVYEKEKLDYMFCLEQGRNLHPQYVLLLEDDAVPKPYLLLHVKYALDNKILKKFVHGEVQDNTEPWLATKLYYPERWMGFSNDIEQLATLLGFACAAGGALLLFVRITCHMCKVKLTTCSLHLILCLGGMYAMLLALVIGRPNILELCRIHPSLYRAVPAPGCCTQATLFPNAQIQGVVNFFNITLCKIVYGLDLALDDYAKNNGLSMYLLVPNLFRHIGRYSALSGKAKEWAEEFLFT